MPFSRRERAAQSDLKKGTISRAKRSAATAGWAEARLWLSNEKSRFAIA